MSDDINVIAAIKFKSKNGKIKKCISMVLLLSVVVEVSNSVGIGKMIIEGSAVEMAHLREGDYVLLYNPGDTSLNQWFRLMLKCNSDWPGSSIKLLLNENDFRSMKGILFEDGIYYSEFMRALVSIPDYLSDQVDNVVPKASSCNVQLIDDHVSRDFMSHPDWKEILLQSVKNLTYSDELFLAKSNDCFWIEGNGLLDKYNHSSRVNPNFWIPIRISNTNDRFQCSEEGNFGPGVSQWLFDVTKANIDPYLCLNALPPNVYLEESCVWPELSTHLKSLQVREVHIIGVYGPDPYYKEQKIIDTCHALGFSVQMLPLDDQRAICRSAPSSRPLAWVFRLSTINAVSYEYIRAISREKSNALLFLLLEDDVPGEELDSRSPKCLLKSLLDKILVTPLMEDIEATDLSRLDLETAKLMSKICPEKSLKTCLKAVKKRGAMSDRGNENEVVQVRWEDVAGLEEAKMILKETILGSQAMNKADGAYKLGRRMGILFYGPPGTGKTMLAKAVATEFQMSFISVKGPELFDIYVGESEAHLRQVFTSAKKSQPCVIFFDELDSLAVMRGRDGDAGGVTDRLVSQLLSEMDKVSSLEYQIYVIGATNRPDLLDPALLRPGRFDKLIHLGIPQTSEEQSAILKAASRRYLMDVDIDFDEIAQDHLPKVLSPAELASIAHGSMKIALANTITRLESSSVQMNDIEMDFMVTIGKEDVLMAINRHLQGGSTKQDAVTIGDIRAMNDSDLQANSLQSM